MSTPRQYFKKVKVARELLREKAEELLEEYLLTVKQAQSSGQPEVALKALQWLIEHMPDDDGERMIDASIDKKVEAPKIDTRPTVQIGINLGGVGTNQKKLPQAKAEVIDAE
jgi:hypothetical protein